jgi:thioredoxin reductase (NADPH)
MAIGDIRSKTVRQVVNAAGEGAVAAIAAEHYLNGLT